jgi:tetratricopeptide (TPR) repeat protein
MSRPWTGDAVAAAPAFVAIAVFAWWAFRDGGFAATVLYPGGLLVLGALLALVVARPDRLRVRRRTTAVALVALLAFTAVSYASLLWADSPGDAWAGANRTLVYTAAFALFALTPFTVGTGAAAVGTVAVVAAAAGVSVLFEAAGGSSVDVIFVDGRLSQPIGYVNGSTAFFTMAFLAASVLASRREAPIFARAALLGAATVLLDLAVLSQSRAWLVFFPLGLLATFVLVPNRMRLLLTLLPVGVVTLLSLPTLLEVYRAFGEPGAVDAIADARDVVLLGGAATAVLGGVGAWLDRRTELPATLGRRADRWLAVAGAALAVVGCVAALVAIGDPVARAADAWDEFESGYPSEFSGSHFTGGGLGDYRADQWRVALNAFAQAPILGTGVGGFGAVYIEERRTNNEAIYPHSVELSVLSSTGLLGALAFAAFLAAVVGGAAALRRSAAPVRAVAAASLALACYWLLHGSVDWFWELPAVTAPAFALLGLAAAVEAQQPEAASRRFTPAAAGAAVAILVGAVALAVPWTATAETERAAAVWRTDPDLALERLDRAGRIDRLSSQPALLAGAIANRSGRPERARAELEEALDREPRNWYAHLELAIAQARLGRRADALASLDEAAALNPREDAIPEVREDVTRGEEIDLAGLDAVFRQRVESRTR